MRLSFLILSICILLASCCKVEETSPVESWEQPHRQMMGLYGPVRSVIETLRNDASGIENESESEVSFKEYRFDSAGRLTYYNPTGTDAGVQTRWIGVASVRYEYEYDNIGRLTRATVYEIGALPRIYRLTYGTHDRYVPLIFPLGPYDFFLVKGLDRITTSDDSLDYRYDGTRAYYSFTSWSGITEVSYQYGKQERYPSRQNSIVTRNGLELSRTVTQYVYAPDGLLLSVAQQTTADNEEESKQITYVTNRFLQPRTVITNDLNGTQEWSYIYDHAYRLTGITLTHNGVDTGEEETYRYSAFDPDGNWTISLQNWNTFIDWAHPNGTVKVTREIR